MAAKQSAKSQIETETPVRASYEIEHSQARLAVCPPETAAELL